EADDQAVLADGLDQGLDAIDLHAGFELVDELHARLGRDAAGAAVGDAARGVDRAEVAADGHVLRADLDADARASSTPRPIWCCSGSYPNRPRCPGPEPGVTPGATGRLRPTVPSAARRSRFGVRAASNSVLPPGSIGRPPRPSATSRTIFEAFGSRSWR